MSLHTWSWLFLVVYIAAMLGFGYLGSRRFAFYSTNPYSPATFGAIVSVLVTVIATAPSKPGRSRHNVA